MRIITGTARGKTLKIPQSHVIRPTSDFVKENIFNIIQFYIEDAVVLDLFCGSGQLGLEALSRGAGSAVFVDMSSEAVKITKDNIKATGFDSVSRVVAGEALQFIGQWGGKADIIFLDPPYGTPLMIKALNRIIEFDILNKGGIIVCECGKNDTFPDCAYEKSRDYSYGAKKIVVFSNSKEEPQ